MVGPTYSPQIARPLGLEVAQRIREAKGRLWKIQPGARLAALEHLTLYGPEALSKCVPSALEVELKARQNAGPSDVVDSYVDWLSSHLALGERPNFALTQESLLNDSPKVLLVSPIYRSDESSIGIVRIVFFLRGLGIQAEWAVAHPDRLDELVAYCRESQFDLIGQGTTHYTFREDMELVLRMSEASPGSRFILGGHGAAVDPDTRTEILAKTPISVVVRGFGERSTARLALLEWKRVCQEACFDLKHIPGTYSLDPLAGVVETGIDTYSEDAYRALHSVFAGDLYPVENGVARFITSTHCPFACVFCSSKNFPEQPATRLPPRDLLDMINESRSLQPSLREIEFNDDNFSIGYRKDGRFRKGTDWLRELADVVRPGELEGLRTYCYSRADTIDDDTLRLLRDRLNLSKIGMGLEHVDIGILKKMKKGTGVDRVLARIRTALRLGLDTNFFVILFCKWERADTLLELVRTSTQLCLEGAHMVYNWGFQPLGGAEVSDDPTNVYLESEYSLEGYEGRYRSKIVPDDPFVGAWFRRMNEDLETFFDLQDSLATEMLGRARGLEEHSDSLWFGAVQREHRNINMSNTLVNLIRVHSMFKYGDKRMDPENAYFESAGRETRAAVLNYIYNGPCFPASGIPTIEDKVNFMIRNLPPELRACSLARVLAEIEVAFSGLSMPEEDGVHIGPEHHRAWAISLLRSWMDALESSNAERNACHARASRLLGIVRTLLEGQPTLGVTGTGESLRGRDYIL